MHSISCWDPCTAYLTHSPPMRKEQAKDGWGYLLQDHENEWNVKTAMPSLSLLGLIQCLSAGVAMVTARPWYAFGPQKTACPCFRLRIHWSSVSLIDPSLSSRLNRIARSNCGEWQNQWQINFLLQIVWHDCELSLHPTAPAELIAPAPLPCSHSSRCMEECGARMQCSLVCHSAWRSHTKVPVWLKASMPKHVPQMKSAGQSCQVDQVPALA